MQAAGARVLSKYTVDGRKVSTKLQQIRLFADVKKEAVFNRRVKFLGGAGLAVCGGAVVFGLYLEKTIAKADGLVVHAHKLPWFHTQSSWNDYDINSVRRGYQVYKQVCAACHTINLYEYRHFVGKVLTEQEAKNEAAELTIQNSDPNEEGEMFMRPGRLTDKLPRPYKNAVLAKKANNGAEPPDLMLITLARHGGEDYIFHLLTGYQDAPAGVKLDPGQAYNPYFPNGSVLSMSQQLYDDGIEYDDGTPATQSQMAKDVTTFLKYLAEPELGERKKMALKLLVFTVPFTFLLLYYKRFHASTIKSQKLAFRTIKGREPRAKPED